MPRLRVLARIALLLLPAGAGAVTLDPDGVGQALIFPYYTVQQGRGGAFNTYVSVVNHSAAAKAVRVRFREARNGAEVLRFNLYLGPQDVWTATVAPTATGAQLFTVDHSCTDPDVRAAQPVFGSAAFVGSGTPG